MFPYLIYPWLPTNCDLPPTLKSLMNSICNYGKEEKTNIYNLAKGSRETIFNFDYPLSDKVNREAFKINPTLDLLDGYDEALGEKQEISASELPKNLKNLAIRVFLGQIYQFNEKAGYKVIYKKGNIDIDNFTFNDFIIRRK